MRLPRYMVVEMHDKQPVVRIRWWGWPILFAQALSQFEVRPRIAWLVVAPVSAWKFFRARPWRRASP